MQRSTEENPRPDPIAAPTDCVAPERATPSSVDELLRHTGYPSISVIVRTEAPTFTPSDASRVEVMLRDASRRLDREFDPNAVAGYVEPLRTMAGKLVGARTADGLALFGGCAPVRAMAFRGRPRERVVIDPTFATRDLVRAVVERPPHLVVAAAKDRAQIVVDDGEAVRATARFDSDEGAEARRDRQGHRHQAQRASRDQRRVEAFLRRIAAAVSDSTDLGNAPVVIAAPGPLAGRLQRLIGDRVIGIVPGSWIDATDQQLAAAVAPVLAEHAQQVASRALTAVADARAAGRTVEGAPQVWEALGDKARPRLVVESDHTYPAYLSDGGRHADAAAVADTPAAIDDLVDEMIETALRRNGRVQFVPPQSLSGAGVVLLR